MASALLWTSVQGRSRLPVRMAISALTIAMQGHSSAVEQAAYNRQVGGSTPSAPTNNQ